jgi:hypothetical protein
MAYQFKIRRIVEFSDTDMAGIVHHAVFYRYMESAEHAFLPFARVVRGAAEDAWPPSAGRGFIPRPILPRRSGLRTRWKSICWSPRKNPRR